LVSDLVVLVLVLWVFIPCSLIVWLHWYQQCNLCLSASRSDSWMPAHISVWAVQGVRFCFVWEAKEVSSTAAHCVLGAHQCCWYNIH